MSSCNRRDFLKAVGVAGASATVGCTSDSARRLVPYLIPDQDIIPGVSTWYATTCRECPAGCGLLAANRDGRVIKLEGNPHHPINGGALCARGQAALLGLYNPDRFRGPQEKQGDRFVPVSWSAAQSNLADRLRELRRQGRGDKVVFLTGATTGAMADLIGEWLRHSGGGRHLIYEPFAYEPLRAANRIVFGEAGIASYRLDQADLLISFGAGFLETWLSNVEYARQFAAFHAPRNGRKHFYVDIASRRSMTGGSSDHQILVTPDGELAVAMALLERMLDRHRQGRLVIDPEPLRLVEQAVGASGWAKAAERFGVEAQVLDALADRIAQAERPLIIAAGLPHAGTQATATAVAANLLCLVKPGSRPLLDFGAASAADHFAPAETMKHLAGEMSRGEVELLLLHEANPVFALPASWNFEQALTKVKTIVAFAIGPDETMRAADLVLPPHSALESWGDYAPRFGSDGLMQPMMGPVFDTRHLGDILLDVAREAGFGDQLPWSDFYELLRERWRERWQSGGAGLGFESFWQEAVRRGGLFETSRTSVRSPSPASALGFSFPSPEALSVGEQIAALVIYPTVQLYDGRGANRPWLQEMPDPVTQTTWGGSVEIHPDTAVSLGVCKGDVVRISTPHGMVEAPVLPIHTVAKGVMALPIGQGHTHYGRYADGVPADPLNLLPAEVDPLCGGLTMVTAATVAKTGRTLAIANTDGNFFQEGRGLCEDLPLSAYRAAVASGGEPEIDLPLPQGYDPRRDIYPAHEHKVFRWCMAVDLDRCIGCGACVAACYAENNLAIVGREQILKGREMSWLRIQRYFSADGSSFRFLPMLCQHCDEAPCESVCPVFAPHHSSEGLNNQVYNRCFGTRFCSQNDPYKVRRFNWFTFTRPETLKLQLNPDVTVRQKGVMEKCSFCVHRIVAAKLKAKVEGRERPGDGEFTTACAQTCPTGALTFGNLLDPESRVAALVKDPRAYQVLRKLNTKPAVIYLKRLTQEL